MAHKQKMSSINLPIAVTVFLLLMSTWKVNSQEMDSTSLTAMFGEDVVLPCHLEPPKDASKMTVEWGRPDLKPRFVFVILDGQEYLANQNQAYKGRASMFPDKLKNGDISLKLSNVRRTDNGRYRCYLSKEKKEYFIKLIVVNSQEMDSTSVAAMFGEDVVLPCHLEPLKDASKMTVEWGRPDLKPRFVFVIFDGQEYLANQNQAYKGRASMFPDKLKNGDISLKLSNVRRLDNVRYRCYFPKEKKEYFLELNVGTLTHEITNWEWALIGGAIGMVIGVLMSLAIYACMKWMQSRSQHGEAGDNVQESSLIYTNPTATGNASVTADINQFKTTQDKVKNELEKQKKDISDQLQQEEAKREENKKELQQLEKKMIQSETSDEKETFLLRKEELLQSQWKLDEIKKHYERQLLNIEKVLEPIEIHCARSMKNN